MTLESQSVPPELDQEAQTDRKQEDVKSDGNSEYKEQHPNAIQDVELAKAMATATKQLEVDMRDRLNKARKLLSNTNNDPEIGRNNIEEAKRMIEYATLIAEDIKIVQQSVQEMYEELEEARALLEETEQKLK